MVDKNIYFKIILWWWSKCKTDTESTMLTSGPIISVFSLPGV